MFHLILGHFLGAFFWQVTYDFKAWEGKNPKLKTMHKSKLKQGRYDHLKTIAQIKWTKVDFEIQENFELSFEL